MRTIVILGATFYSMTSVMAQTFSGTPFEQQFDFSDFQLEQLDVIRREGLFPQYSPDATADIDTLMRRNIDDILITGPGDGGGTPIVPIPEVIPPNWRASLGNVAVDTTPVASGLQHCEVPFEQLVSTPMCTERTVPGERRCETYAPAKFTEVMAVRVRVGVSCTGTLVAPDWVLTAGHCVVGRIRPLSFDLQSTGSPFVELSLGAPAIVMAGNASRLAPREQVRTVSFARVHANYGGQTSVPYYRDDLAVLKLESGFPSEKVHPAAVGVSLVSEGAITIAGYGFSEADGGTLGAFNLTWLDEVAFSTKEVTFTPSTDVPAAFCQGDSGGPGFLGYHRGCETNEAHPRPLVAVSSYNYIMEATGSALAHARACIRSSGMIMQNVGTIERRNWICEATDRQAGCL